MQADQLHTKDFSTQCTLLKKGAIFSLFSKKIVKISQAELVQLKHAAHSYEALFLRAQARVHERDATIKHLREQHHLKIETLRLTLQEEIAYVKKRAHLKLQAVKKEITAEFHEKIALLEAKITLREHQLFGKKTEKKYKSENSKTTKANQRKGHRGQPHGKPGHGRRKYDNLPVEEEHIELEPADRCCPDCKKPYLNFAGEDKTEDSEILEIEVKTYKRRIRRKKYKKGCQCKNRPALLTAPKVPRLISKGKLGISIWVEIILGKFDYYYPVNRRLRELSVNGLKLPAGTVTDGLKKIQPLFDKLYEALTLHNQGARHWHADETRWFVYADPDVKKGHQWCLWLFRSNDSFVFQLDPSRSSRVPKTYFEKAEGILSVDRYAAYKAMQKVTRIILAYCWAHVRRDFLELVKKYSDSERWAMDWIAGIAKLYHLNNHRVAYREDKKQFSRKDCALRKAISKMEKKFLKQLQQSDKKIPLVCKKVLISLKNHWAGLQVFVENPEVPMDNNKAENGLRGPVVLRKNSQGSRSEWSGLLAAVLFSLIETLKLWEINTPLWMREYLQACADHGGKLPAEWKHFLPWEMSPERLSYFGGKSPVLKPPDNSS